MGGSYPSCPENIAWDRPTVPDFPLNTLYESLKVCFFQQKREDLGGQRCPSSARRTATSGRRKRKERDQNDYTRSPTGPSSCGPVRLPLDIVYKLAGKTRHLLYYTPPTWKEKKRLKGKIPVRNAL